ncbi:MAG: phage holin family protein [Candidatus Eremiobacteraeota bacterium]|nr:phage holin family protein [Candidatus Eremiobacteraeota bacterium]MDQ6933164.1 phage holin family protein [Candidatus Eremiobacteraeota bacterium]
MHLLIRFVVNAIVLYLIAKYVPGFNHDAGVSTAIVAAIVFGLVNAIIGPILRLLSAPINWVTHGLFSFVINFILFALTVWITPGLRHNGEINGWLANLYGTIIMTVVATILQQIWQPRSERTTEQSV